MRDLQTASQGSFEPEAGWFDLFSSRYWKGIPKFLLTTNLSFLTPWEKKKFFHCF